MAFPGMEADLQSPQESKRRTLRRTKRRRAGRHWDALALNPSPECVVGFQRVPDLRRALRAARRQRLKIQYIQRDDAGVPIHAVVEWNGKPVIVTDSFEGSEI